MPKQLRHLLPALVAFALTPSILIAHDASATTVLALDINALARRADNIVEARVAETRTEWNDAKMQIYTYVTFDIIHVFAGAILPGQVVFRCLGGRAPDGTRVIVEGAPTFTVGEHLVLFLYDDPTLHIPVVGLGQGKLSWKLETRTGREVFGNSSVGFFETKQLSEQIRRARGGVRPRE